MHYDFVPIAHRNPLKWPNGKRLAVILTINMEYWDPVRDTTEPYYPGGPASLAHLLEMYTITLTTPGGNTVSVSGFGVCLIFLILRAFPVVAQ